MANTNINPFGAGGQAAAGLGIANDFVTDRADVSLSAAKGKEINDNLNGTLVPFDQDGYWSYSNGSYSFNSSGSNAKHTVKLTIADYEHIYYTGGCYEYAASFGAVFFDSNDDVVGSGLLRYGHHLTTPQYDRDNHYYVFTDVLANVPAGAVKVALQCSNKYTDGKVVVITKSSNPYNTIANEYSTQDMYGIVGDGITDDTEALQMMFNSAEGDISLRPAVYRITETLLMNTRVCRRLAGNGATLLLDVDDDTTPALRVTGPLPNNTSSDPYKAVFIMRSAGAVIENLHITSVAGDESSENSTGVGNGIGIAVDTCFKTIIKNCLIYQMAAGIVFKKTTTSRSVRDIILEGNNIYHCAGSGIEVADDVSLHQFNIVNNHISYCKYGINFDNPKELANVQIVGNDIETKGGFPYGVTDADKRCLRIYCTSSTNACYEMEVVGNTLQGHANTADNIVEIIGRSGYTKTISITGNHFSNCGGDVLSISDSSVVAVSGNNTNNTAGGFVKLAGTCSQINVSGNAMNSSNKKMLSIADSSALTGLSVNGNTGNGTPVTIDGTSVTLDYISVVGNNLGGGTVTVGDATHKVVENNI